MLEGNAIYDSCSADDAMDKAFVNSSDWLVIARTQLFHKMNREINRAVTLRKIYHLSPVYGYMNNCIATNVVHFSR